MATGVIAPTPTTTTTQQQSLIATTTTASQSLSQKRLTQGYASDDEYFSSSRRKKEQQKYSREDFKEIYCINQKAIEGLEKSRSTGFLFLGCLSSYQESPCKRRYTRSTSTESGNIFTSCYSGEPQQQPQQQQQYYQYQQQYPYHQQTQIKGHHFTTSDEDIRHHLQQQQQQPKYIYYYHHHEPLYAQTSSSSSRIIDTNNSSKSFIDDFDGFNEGTTRRRPRSVAETVSRESLYNEAKRFTWNEQMERYVERSDLEKSQPRQQQQRPPAFRYPSAPLQHHQGVSSTKHVSFFPSDFTRSATSTSFDEHKIRKARFDLMNGGISQERLIDTMKCNKTEQNNLLQMTPVLNKTGSLIGSRTSLAISMRTQATQTETFIVRAGGPPPYLSLSPRTSYRSRMISQGAQTNGMSSPNHVEIHPTKVKPTTTTTTTTAEVTKEDKELSPVTPPTPLEIEQTEEEFHENLYQLFSSSGGTAGVTPEDDDQTVISKASPTSTSSSGSYSLNKEMMMMQSFKLSELQEPPIETNDELFKQLLLQLVIKPPEGFGDSNGSHHSNNEKINYTKKTTTNKLIKKKPSIRAKSEERYSYNKIDAATQSSISLHASLHDLTTIDDDDCGIYMEPYTNGIWIYIGPNEELQVWKKHEPLTRTSSGESTVSEQEFCKKFIALTHRMVHRKASGETYKRLAENALVINKRISLTRSSTISGGEYGFRIHGSRPVVVSAVESNSPAEMSGLEVGDVIMSINGIHVLDSSHSDVVRIASQAEALELELARTADVVNNLDLLYENEDDVLIQGHLLKFNNKLEQLQDHNNWIKRYFRLKSSDYCLYYYKSGEESSQPPLSVLPLTKPIPVTMETLQIGDLNVIQLKRSKETLINVSSFDINEFDNWVDAINTILNQSVQDDKWIGLSGKYVMCSPNSIINPDCIGLLWKLGRRIKNWSRKYIVLKDACLYFYHPTTTDQQQQATALGATHLHGYRVSTVSILGGKRHVFELVPPENSMRHYYLATDNEHERKRWLAALEYSIDRWINLNNTNNRTNQF